jgi:hypothetical protein
MMGAERKSMVMDDAEKEMTAYHEAGHAILIDLTFLAIGNFCICTFKMASLPLISGKPTIT